MKPIVSIIMGSDSDLPIMQASAQVLEDFNIPYELTIVSAHRTPDRLVDYAKSAEDKGLRVVIAGAGGAAHLPGMVASFTNLPVIGVPIKTKTMNGIDSLYAIVSMPPGVPVATVAINGSFNAGLLAAQIIGTYDKGVKDKMQAYKQNLKETVLNKAATLETIGYQQYLKNKE